MAYEVSALKEKSLWLFDMDGTIYEGERVFEGTNPLLRRIRELGGEYMFLTNNSSKSVSDYVAKLQRMGIDAEEEDFFTSVQATERYLRKHYPGALVYVQGTRSMVTELERAGIRVTEEVSEDAGVILVGFDTELTFEKLRRTSEMLTRFPGVPYIATNLDLVCPVEGGFVPDCGSMCIGLKNATGREPRVIGKPEPVMIDTAMELRGKTKKDTVLVGDRLYTDIASGVNAGVTTVLVLSGEATEEDAESYEKKPTVILRDVGEIWSVLN